MFDIQVIDDPAAATVALEPMRSQLLSELAAPASAATLATRVGLARQKVNYHLHAVEGHGLVQLERTNFRFAHIPKANHSSPLTKGGSSRRCAPLPCTPWVSAL